MLTVFLGVFMRLFKILAFIGVATFALISGSLQAKEQQPANEASGNVVAVAVVRSADGVLDALAKGALKIDEPAVLLALGGAKAYINLNGPLGGFDTGKPLALVVCANNTGYLALPVKDVEILKDRFVKSDENASLTESEESKGLFEFTAPKKNVKKAYLRFIDGWLLISENPKAVPETIDPAVAETVKALVRDYLIAVKFSTQSIDPANRIQAIEDIAKQVRENCPEKDEKLPAVCDELFKQWGKSIVSALKSYAGDGPELIVGLSVDEEKGILIETKALAPKDSKSAKALNKLSKISTSLAGFYQPESDWAVRVSGKAKLVNDKQIDQILNLIGEKLYAHVDEKVKDEKKNSQIKKDLVELKKIVAKTMGAGVIDFAASAELSADKGVSLVCARYDADGYKAEEFAGAAIDRLRELCPEKGEKLDEALTVNVENINGTRIHTITIPVPDSCPNKEKAQKLVGGKDLVVAIAFGKHLIATSVGVNALENLKTALKNSPESKSAPAFEYTQRPLELLKTAAEFCPAMQKWSDELNSFKKDMGKTFEKCGLERFEIVGIKNGVALRYNLSWSGLKTKIKMAPYLEKIKGCCGKDGCNQ